MITLALLGVLLISVAAVPAYVAYRLHKTNSDWTGNARLGTWADNRKDSDHE